MAADVSERAPPGSTHGTLLGRPVDELAAAIRFLTRIPLWGTASRGGGARAEPRTGAAAFGIVGLGLGAGAALPLVLVGGTHPIPAAVIALGLVAVLGGALHLDGLADTADALAAPSGAAERARTDPRSGSAGVVALVLVLGLDAALLAELAARGALTAAAAIVVATAVSRASAPVWGVLARRSPGAAGGGLGRWFADQTSPASAAIAAGSAAAVAVLLAAVAGWWVVAAAVVGSLLAATVGGAVVVARRQLDGDGFGALIEIAFSAVLLAAAVVR